MKRNFLFVGIFVVGLIVINVSFPAIYSQNPQKTPVKQQTMKYTCPMHPEIIRDKPGNYPKCGMKLIEKIDKPAKDSTKIKNDHKKVMHDPSKMNDPSMMKNGHMMHDTTH